MFAVHEACWCAAFTRSHKSGRVRQQSISNPKDLQPALPGLPACMSRGHFNSHAIAMRSLPMAYSISLISLAGFMHYAQGPALNMPRKITIIDGTACPSA